MLLIATRIREQVHQRRDVCHLTFPRTTPNSGYSLLFIGATWYMRVSRNWRSTSYWSTKP